MGEGNEVTYVIYRETKYGRSYLNAEGTYGARYFATKFTSDEIAELCIKVDGLRIEGCFA